MEEARFAALLILLKKEISDVIFAFENRLGLSLSTEDVAKKGWISSYFVICGKCLSIDDSVYVFLLENEIVSGEAGIGLWHDCCVWEILLVYLCALFLLVIVLFC